MKLPQDKHAHALNIKMDEKTCLESDILEHLVEGGVGVEEDKDPLSDDLALNANFILCRKFQSSVCKMITWMK